MWLLLPAGTDIRDSTNYSFTVDKTDMVEVPAASGRIYVVEWVDDVGKGFPNEFRVAAIAKASGWGLWPSPIP